MELKYPDDEEKKNSVCLSLDLPETSEDYFLAAQINNQAEFSILIGRGPTRLGSHWLALLSHKEPAQASKLSTNQIKNRFISYSSLVLYGIRTPIMGPLPAWKPTILMP